MWLVVTDLWTFLRLDIALGRGQLGNTMIERTQGGYKVTAFVIWFFGE